MQLLDSDWPASILAGAHFRTLENGLMSPDGVCAISAGPAGHETSSATVSSLLIVWHSTKHKSLLFHGLKLSFLGSIAAHLNKIPKCLFVYSYQRELCFQSHSFLLGYF